MDYDGLRTPGRNADCSSCVEARNRGLVAHFGYRSAGAQPRHASRSARVNMFAPDDENRGQPITFEPGTCNDVVAVPFSGSLAWRLAGQVRDGLGGDSRRAAPRSASTKRSTPTATPAGSTCCWTVEPPQPVSVTAVRPGRRTSPPPRHAHGRRTAPRRRHEPRGLRHVHRLPRQRHRRDRRAGPRYEPRRSRSNSGRAHRLRDRERPRATPPAPVRPTSAMVKSASP